ncbi:MAG: hypothetical protein LBR07_09200 [Puniceicoccales bacterium]|jgi:hypothetical protein|nr:hypothetical protein [Puniceicoccales bacterium]
MSRFSSFGFALLAGIAGAATAVAATGGGTVAPATPTVAAAGPALPVTDAAPKWGLPPVFDGADAKRAFADSRTRVYLAPKRVLWKNAGAKGNLVRNENALLKRGVGQSQLGGEVTCSLTTEAVPASAAPDKKVAAAARGSILLDFGREIQGGIQIVGTGGRMRGARVRVRFGESATEAMTETPERGSTNDHAMRDFVVQVPWMGVVEAGNSGFRFARLDLLDAGTLGIKEVNAVFAYRDIPYRGSFKSSDPRLDQIWLTGAYTVHLNMQEFIWDGIKRDRLVWLGDLHPEVMTVSSVFGHNEVIPKSLDFARDITPLPRWMNGMYSYSLWWIIIHRDWYLYQGDLDYLRRQQTYLTGLLNILLKRAAAARYRCDFGGFLDWPSSGNRKGVQAGMHGLLRLAFQAGAELATTLGDKTLADRCADAARRMGDYLPPHNNLKSAAAILALSDILPATRADAEVIAVGGPKQFSTFYGYYMLQAQAKAGNYAGALDNIRKFWGGMLDLGATTFWEDFNLDWVTPGVARIDELAKVGQKDIHADYGAYCYRQLRHSLCHGWASGPTAWLTEHVLGVKVVEPGCRAVKIEPHLGDLAWVEGAFPTPLGDIRLRHERAADGSVKTTLLAVPAGVRIVK